MGNGTIQGGWEYVWAAYGLVGFGFFGYGIALVRQQKYVRCALRHMDQAP